MSLSVQLLSDRADAAPGADVTVVVDVRNDGRTAVRPVLSVRGLDGGSVHGAPVPALLGPGESMRTELVLQLPLDANAGIRTVAVVAEDVDGKVERAMARFALHTGSASEISVHVSPREVRGRVRSKLMVNLHNHGNESLQLALTGSGHRTKVRMSPATVDLPAGHSVRVRATVTSRPVLWRSGRRPFLITAQGTSTPTSASGTFEQHVLLPTSITRIVAIVLALAVWASAAAVGVKALGARHTTSSAIGSSASSSDADGGGSGNGSDGSGGSGGGSGGGSNGGSSGGGSGSAAGAAGGGDADASGITAPPTALITGTVAGPSNPAGIAVLIERITLGDVPGDATGKLAAQSVSVPLSGDVLDTQRTRTDESGRFRVASGLEVPGIYRVSAVQPGFEVASVIATLSAEQPVAELALTLASASGSLSGMVRGDDGNAIGGAVITVTDDALSYSTVTASDGTAAGSWTIDGVHTPTTYVVTAAASGYATATTVVTLSGGQSMGDVSLRLAKGLGTVRGMVSSRGTGVGGITITARSVDGSVTDRTTTTLTDGAVAGSYAIPGLPYGRYSLTLSAEGWLTQTREVVIDRGDVLDDVTDLRRSTAVIQGRVFQDAAANCQFPDPNTALTDITAQPCGNVGVTVSNDRGTWRTTSATGTGAFVVSGVPAGTYTVTLERYGYVPITVTATVGAGDINTLGPIAGNGYGPLHLILGSGNGESTSGARGVLRDDSDPSTILHVECLKPRIKVTEGSGVSAHAIVAEAPVSGCATVTSAPPDANGFVCPILPGSTATDPRACLLPDGGVQIEAISPGAKVLEIEVAGFDTWTSVVTIPATGLAELGVLRLVPLATVSGLLSGANDSPIAQGRVFFGPTDPTATVPAPPNSPDGGWYACSVDVTGDNVEEHGICVESNTNGEYKLGRALGTGEYRVVAPIGAVTTTATPITPSRASLDHERRTRVMQVVAGSSTTFDISLRRYGAVAGVIQTPDATGTGYISLDGVAVTTTAHLVGSGSAGTPRDQSGPTDLLPIGRYRVDRLQTLDPLSYYSITFTKAGFDPQTIDIAGGVPFNSELLRNVVLVPPPFTVVGDVTWRSDVSDASTANNIAGATVKVTGITRYEVLDIPPYREPVFATFTATTDANGHFTGGVGAPTLVGSQITIEVSKAGFATRTLTMAAPTPNGSGVSTVPLVLEPEVRTIDGFVSLSPIINAIEPSGLGAAILSGLTVTVRPTYGGPSLTTAVASTGSFAIPNIRPDVRTNAYEVKVSGPGVTTTTLLRTFAPTDTNAPVEYPSPASGGNAPITVNRLGHLTVQVNDSSGVGLGGVTIQLLNSASAVVGTTTSCSSGCTVGSAHFTDLPLGTYSLVASRSGYASTTTNNVDLATAPTQTVVMPNLVRFGTISGTVLSRMAVGDPTSPMAGALVRATQGGLTVTTLSAADGSFTLSGNLPPGSWNVDVSSTGYSAPAASAFTVTNESDTPTGSITLTAIPATLAGVVTDGLTGTGLNPGTVTVVEANDSVPTAADGSYSIGSLPPRTYTVVFHAADGRADLTRIITLRPAETGSLSVTMAGPVGSVIGFIDAKDSSADSAAPSSGASIVLTRTGFPAITTTTSSGGNFNLTGVPVGTYTATVSASGYASDVRTIAVAANQQHYLSATLLASGRTLTVTVRSSDSGLGNVPGVTVSALRNGATTPITAVSNGSGVATLTGLAPGTYALTTTDATNNATPHADSSGSSFTVGVGDPSVTLTTSLTLNRYESLTATVNVRPNSATPAAASPDAQVTAQRLNAGGNPTGSVITLNHTTGGIYSYAAALTSGTWRITATGLGYATNSIDVTLANDAQVSGSVTLTATARTVVVTVESDTGGNLGGVTVTATSTSPAGSASGTSDSTGTVTLSLQPGSWDLATSGAASATKASVLSPHEDDTVSITVIPGDPAVNVPTTIILPAASTAIAGHIRSVFGGAAAVDLSGASISAQRNNGSTSFTTTSDGNGLFSLSLPPSRTWNVSVTATGHQSASTTATTGSTGTTAMGDIDLTRSAATVHGQVHTASGGGSNGISGSVVTIRVHGSATVLNTTTTGSNGQYSFSGLDPFNTFDVTFDTSGVSTANQQHPPVSIVVSPTVPGANITRDHIVPTTAGVIAVTVDGALVNQAGATHHSLPVNATVVLSDTASTPAIDPITLTTSGGVATFSKLPTGSSYRVQASATNYASSDGSAAFVAQTNVSVTNSSTTSITLTLYPVNRPVAITVHDADGNAVVGADVALSGGGLTSTAHATSNGSGVADFASVPVSTIALNGSTYTVAVSASGYASGNETGFSVPAGSAATTVSHTVTFSRIDLDVRGRSDTVTTFASATALTTGVTIVATPPSGAAPTFTHHGAGIWRTEGMIPTGAWSMTVSATGYADSITPVNLSSQIASADVLMTPPTRTVTEAVSSSAGGALSGVAVRAVRQTSGDVVTGTTGAGGTVDLALIAGTWTLTTTNAIGLAVPHADDAGTTLVVPSAPAAITPAPIVLDRLERITVHVTDGTSAVDGAVVTAQIGAGSPTTLTALGGGDYRLVGALATGPWTIDATATGFSPGTGSVSAVADGDATATITLVVAPPST